jgi:L-rhamnose mutarotase
VPRACFTLQVRPDRLAEYRERHAAVWPEMLRALRDAGWRDYQLYLRDDGLLVGIVETADLSAAQAAMDRTEVSARWEAEMAPFFVPGGDGRDKSELTLVFDLDAQLTTIGETP